MPLGDVEIDAPLAAELAHSCPRLHEDEVAHHREHSLEVQIPFLQRWRFLACGRLRGPDH